MKLSWSHRWLLRCIVCSSTNRVNPCESLVRCFRSDQLNLRTVFRLNWNAALLPWLCSEQWSFSRCITFLKNVWWSEISSAAVRTVTWSSEVLRHKHPLLSTANWHVFIDGGERRRLAPEMNMFFSGWRSQTLSNFSSRRDGSSGMDESLHRSIFGHRSGYQLGRFWRHGTVERPGCISAAQYWSESHQKIIEKESSQDFIAYSNGFELSPHFILDKQWDIAWYYCFLCYFNLITIVFSRIWKTRFSFETSIWLHKR